ncbi:hypothetical protein OHC51_03725 [Stenotrophomonas indicatrix]|uniref:hypothetical protein n=1 Tax=Stenotrophomonas indicatrix TaxID=2045451 RepID=UPI00300B3B0E
MLFPQEQIDASRDHRRHCAQQVLQRLKVSPDAVASLLQKQDVAAGAVGANRVVEACIALYALEPNRFGASMEWLGGGADEPQRRPEAGKLEKALCEYLKKGGPEWVEQRPDGFRDSPDYAALKLLGKSLDGFIKAVGPELMEQRLGQLIAPAVADILKEKNPDVCASRILDASSLQRMVNVPAINDWAGRLRGLAESSKNLGSLISEFCKLPALLEGKAPAAAGPNSLNNEQPAASALRGSSPAAGAPWPAMSNFGNANPVQIQGGQEINLDRGLSAMAKAIDVAIRELGDARRAESERTNALLERIIDVAATRANGSDGAVAEADDEIIRDQSSDSLSDALHRLGEFYIPRPQLLNEADRQARGLRSVDSVAEQGAQRSRLPPLHDRNSFVSRDEDIKLDQNSLDDSNDIDVSELHDPFEVGSSVGRQYPVPYMAGSLRGLGGVGADRRAVQSAPDYVAGADLFGNTLERQASELAAGGVNESGERGGGYTIPTEPRTPDGRRSISFSVDEIQLSKSASMEGARSSTSDTISLDAGRNGIASSIAQLGDEGGASMLVDYLIDRPIENIPVSNSSIVADNYPLEELNAALAKRRQHLEGAELDPNNRHASASKREEEPSTGSNDQFKPYRRSVAFADRTAGPEQVDTWGASREASAVDRAGFLNRDESTASASLHPRDEFSANRQVNSSFDKVAPEDVDTWGASREKSAVDRAGALERIK